MLTLTDMAGLRRKISLNLAGRVVEAQPLSFADEELIDGLEPLPRVPLAPPPGKGSLAEPVPDTEDPAYVAAMARRFGRLALLTVAAACNYKPERGGEWQAVRHDAKARAEWASAAIIEMGTSLTEAAIVTAHRQLRAGADLAALAAEAAKN